MKRFVTVSSWHINDISGSAVYQVDDCCFECDLFSLKNYDSVHLECECNLFHLKNYDSVHLENSVHVWVFAA